MDNIITKYFNSMHFYSSKRIEYMVLGMLECGFVLIFPRTLSDLLFRCIPSERKVVLAKCKIFYPVRHHIKIKARLIDSNFYLRCAKYLNLTFI